MKKTDFLVLGSGIAGMSTAILLARMGSVALISKSKLLSGSTPWAQGGIAFSSGADTETHIQDTLRAGRQMNNENAVRQMIDSIPAVRNFLEEECGAVFDESVHREGGHSVSRIFHVADQTGLFLAQTLAQKIREGKNISVFEHHFAVDLLKNEDMIFGASVWNGTATEAFFAKKTIIATGGIGQIFSATTNPIESTGDGIAMAIRAGIHVRNMEFVQFHPTALLSEDSPLFLLSEALRGAGARIVNKNEEEICNPLLPRDEVAQAIFVAQKNTTAFLDLRHETNAFWKSHFPAIFAKLEEQKLSPEKDLIPITPAAHFVCGGIATDLSGKTNLKNAFAVGEVAETGIHGANRLASNSLLEAVSFALKISEEIAKAPSETENEFLGKIPSFIPEAEKDALIRKKIQIILFRDFGILREKTAMKTAQEELSTFSPLATETQNCLMVAHAIASAARARTTSMGTHLVFERRLLQKLLSKIDGIPLERLRENINKRIQNTKTSNV